VSPILDPVDGRGNAPWGLASAVAGPQSGYAWQFDKDIYDANPARPPIDYLTVGPWQRIRHPGSQIAKDQAGLLSTAIGYVGVDAIQVGGAAAGIVVDSANPLPANVNAVRIAHGGIELGRPETIRLRIKVLQDPAPNVPPYDANGCFQIRADAFGGDAGGEQGGKDHLWRYYAPVKRLVFSCAIAQKAASTSLVPLNGVFTYRIDFINQSTSSLPNVLVSDALPAGLTFVSANPPQASGPNPLTWTIPIMGPNSIATFNVTVQAASAGDLTNTVNVTSNGTVVASGQDTVLVGSEALLRYSKTVAPSNANPGQTVQYTLTVNNDGSGPQTLPLVITELLPPGFSYQSLVSASVNGGPLALSSVSANATNPNRPVFSVAAPIQAAKFLQLVFNVQIGAQVPGGTYSNVVQLAYNGKVIGGTPTAPVTVAVGTIGDTVFRDWNNNGIQDATDEGVAGASVGLFAGACPPAGAPVATTATDSSGKYLLNGVASGSYCVGVSGPAVAGYSGTTARPVTIASGQSDLSIDFPLVPGGSGQIGDRVFDDRDVSGTFSAGDVGIPGVTVQLYEDTNGNGVIDATDALVATTTTDATGLYAFGALATGVNYIAKVDAADPALTAFYGATFSNTTPLRQSSALTVGAPSDLARDFGFVRPGSIGDQVYIDANGNGVFDAGEQGLPNVTVTLTHDANGNGVADPGEVQATTVTDAAGKYLFANLPGGNYVVTVDITDVDLPANLVPRVPISRSLALGAGQSRLDMDFGFAASLTKSVNPLAATSGATLTYTLQPYYPGPALLSNALITDPIPANATYVAGSANAGGTLNTGVVPNQVEWPLGSNASGGARRHSCRGPRVLSRADAREHDRDRHVHPPGPADDEFRQQHEPLDATGRHPEEAHADRRRSVGIAGRRRHPERDVQASHREQAGQALRRNSPSVDRVHRRQRHRWQWRDLEHAQRRRELGSRRVFGVRLRSQHRRDRAAERRQQVHIDRHHIARQAVVCESRDEPRHGAGRDRHRYGRRHVVIERRCHCRQSPVGDDQVRAAAIGHARDDRVPERLAARQSGRDHRGRRHVRRLRCGDGEQRRGDRDPQSAIRRPEAPADSFRPGRHSTGCDDFRRHALGVPHRGHGASYRPSPARHDAVHCFGQL
jgi:uncharacterized repeat protein (TIGR01451 family)